MFSDIFFSDFNYIDFICKLKQVFKMAMSEFF